MNTIVPPTFSVEQPDRARECAFIASGMIASFIKQSVAAGWREQEIALALADAADDYVVYLAKKPPATPVAANSNGR